MHSSRMCTIHSSGRISGGVPGPGGCVPGLGGTWSGGYLVGVGVSVPVLGVHLVWGGTWSQGGLYLVLGGCTWSGASNVPGLGGVPGQVLPPCGQTHTCKNITFATSLRTVKIHRWMNEISPLNSINLTLIIRKISQRQQ